MNSSVVQHTDAAGVAGRLTDDPLIFTFEPPVRTGCARCAESFNGSLEAGRMWFREHLAAKHPEVRVKPRPKLRPPLRSPGPPSLKSRVAVADEAA